MSNVMRLLALSLDRSSDHLLSFVSAWAAIELFLDHAFPLHVPAMINFITIHDTTDPVSLATRLKVVMREKRFLARKFEGVAMILSSHDADEDLAKFKAANAIRNKFYHKMGVAAAELPVTTVSNLLRKYARLHLACG